MNRHVWMLLAVGLLSACGDSGGRPRRPGTGTTDGSVDGDGGVRPVFDAGPCTPSGAEGSVESCTDGLDNDCDGRFDCADEACSGVGPCPVCGSVDTQLGAPLALPDGVGGTSCSSGSSCPGAQQCFDLGEDLFGGRTFECRESYRSSLDFIGFAPTATFTDVSDIVSVCVTMEHSWVRDLEMRLEAPNGQFVQLQAFEGRDVVEEVYLGTANDCDEDDVPSPGTGARYCWTPTATRPAMFTYANGTGPMDSVTDCNGGTADMLPPGDYGTSTPFTNLIGTPMNGRWTLSVTDLWGIDNGYIFDWSITFNARNVEDCSSPLI
ncbi:MAG: hypothetical protein H6721_20890 [Sandaracinus sp.]|nr:hypothetical protein [Sandaracinus sp.]MCB9617862.1 hypothetical protein [Sandaracinus sp.]MCB9634589.1 hypothetical protein [Sandaracinus sp.]